jgi:hypothetical protein
MGSGQERRVGNALALLLSAAAGLAQVALPSPAAAAATEPPAARMEAPRVRSMLEHAWAAESGVGQQRNADLAVYLYCQAARSGSAEGHYRAGRVLAAGSGEDHRAAAFFLATAVELGHGRAIDALESLLRQRGPVMHHVPGCFRGDPYDPPAAAVASVEEPAAPERGPGKSVGRLFDLDAYVASLRPERRRVAALVLQHAQEFGIDRRLALAIASVESNFDPLATSPKNARGVMQLIPETAKRFKVSNPYDPVESIRGGLAYLRWLSDYFAGDMVRVVAAYNAGEGAVNRHNGVPPYEETRLYVRRVIELAGIPLRRPVRHGPAD